MLLHWRTGGSRARPAWVALLCLLIGVTTAGSASADSATIDASVQVLAIEVDLSLSTSEARVGDKVKAEATVTNRGETRVAVVTLELRVDSTGLAIRGSPTVTIVRLQPGRSSTASWTLCALEPGNYVLLVRGTLDGVSVDSAAHLVSVSGLRRKGCT